MSANLIEYSIFNSRAVLICFSAKGLFIYWNVSNSECLICLQEIKKAVLSDMIKLGKEAGLKSFEQVMYPCEFTPNWNNYTCDRWQVKGKTQRICGETGWHPPSIGHEGHWMVRIWKWCEPYAPSPSSKHEKRENLSEERCPTLQ